MKKTLALLLALVMVLSLCACGGKNTNASINDAPANLVVDGKETSAKDFLIDCLSEYIHSEEYLERTAEYENIFRKEASPFEVTYAFELKITNYGNEKIPLHFLMVKAKCDYLFDGGSYDGMEMLVDYDTGMVYNKFNVDESWMTKDNKSEAICVAAVMGGFCDSRYNGEPIFNDSEVHIQFSESDIAEINQALSK